MKRAGFTMIELIFVIVILGILSAVALPKMVGVAESAKVGTVESFMATMNRSVGPSMWADALTGTGSVTGLKIKNYIDLPTGITIDLSKCGANDANNSKYTGKAAGAVSTAALPNAEVIYCEDGNSVGAPVFSFVINDVNGSVQKN